MAVIVVFAIGVVVLLVIGDEIVQREAVMRRNEVDARPGLAAALVVDVAGAKKARGEVLRLAVVVLPIFAHAVAIFVVPFGPTGRKAADLIAARADIPGFADQLHASQRRILGDGVEEAAALVEAIGLAPRIEPRSKRKPSTSISSTQ